MTASTLLLGYGDLAARVSRHLTGPWTGARRSPAPHCVQADATSQADLRRLLAPGFDRIVLSLTPAERTESGYRDTYVAAASALTGALRELGQCPRIVFVSSTSVYGQNAGEWVDETSPALPGGFAGEQLLAAEQCLLDSGLPVVIARLTGIYGPGRDRLLSQVKAGKVSRNLLAYSNRIHSEDAARALVHLMDLEGPEPCYLVSDNTPVLLAEVVRDLAAQLGVAGPELSLGAPFTGKRVSNARLKASGWQPAYPDWRAGYREILQAS